MIALLLFLFELPNTRWYLLAISVAAWLALTIWELRATAPFIDVRLLASNRALTRTYLRFGLVLLCLYVVLYGITQWVEGVRGLSETEAGLMLLPMTLVSGLVIAPVSRRNLVRGPVIAAAFCLPGRLGGGAVLSAGPPGSAGSSSSRSSSASPWASPSAGNQTALYFQAPAEQSAPQRGCCAPSATSAPSPRRPSPGSSSTPGSATAASTSSPGS